MVANMHHHTPTQCTKAPERSSLALRESYECELRSQIAVQLRQAFWKKADIR
jgi:hypothetical protein